MASLKPTGQLDKPLARELYLGASNDGNLYRQQIQPCINNLARKKAKGIYNKRLAVKLFMYPIETYAKKYKKDYCTPDFRISNKTKILAASLLLRAYSDEVNEAAAEIEKKKAKKTTRKRK